MGFLGDICPWYGVCVGNIDLVDLNIQYTRSIVLWLRNRGGGWVLDYLSDVWWVYVVGYNILYKDVGGY